MSDFYATLSEHEKQLPIYLTTVGIFYDETIMVREQGYPDYQWIQTIKGQGTIEYQGKKITAKENSLLLLPANTPHSYYKSGDLWQTTWFSFNGNTIDDLMHYLKLTDICLYQLSSPEVYLNRIQKMYSLAAKDYSLNALTLSKEVYSILESFYRNIHSSTTENHKNSPLNLAIHYIETNYHEDLTIEAIAAYSNVSPQYLCRLFNSKLNLRPFEYIKNYRINQAKQLLVQNETLSISQVATMVGINNPSYFAALFKSIENTRPRDFVKLHQRGVL